MTDCLNEPDKNDPGTLRKSLADVDLQGFLAEHTGFEPVTTATGRQRAVNEDIWYF